MRLQARKAAAHEHGQYIYAYAHKRTNQVLYSLHRYLDPHQSLKQLPDLGANNNPPKLRRDLWLPLFTLAFPRAFPPNPTTTPLTDPANPSRLTPATPENPLGLLAYRKLREWRKLHEYHWRPPASLAQPYSEQEWEAVKERIEKRGGGKKETPYGFISREKQKVRVREVQDQKARSVADLASVLSEIGGLAGEWEEGVRAERWAEVREMVELREEVERGGLEALESEMGVVRVWAETKEKKGEVGRLSRREAQRRLWELERKRARMLFAVDALREAKMLGDAVENVRRELSDAVRLAADPERRAELTRVSEAVAKAGQQIADNDGALDTVREWIQQANEQLQQKEDAERAAQQAAAERIARRDAARAAARAAKNADPPSIKDRLGSWMSSKPDSQQTTPPPETERASTDHTSTLSDQEATILRHEIQGYEMALEQAEKHQQHAAQRAEVISAVQRQREQDLQEKAARQQAKQLQNQEAIEEAKKPHTPALWLQDTREKTAERLAVVEERISNETEEELLASLQSWRGVLTSSLEVLDSALDLQQQAQAGTAAAQEELETRFVAAQTEWKMCRIWLSPRQDGERLKELRRKAEALRFAVAAVRGVEAERVDVNERGEVKGVVVAARVDAEKGTRAAEKKKAKKQAKQRGAKIEELQAEGEEVSGTPAEPPTPQTQLDHDLRTVSNVLDSDQRQHHQRHLPHQTPSPPPSTDLDAHLTLFPSFPTDPYPAPTTPRTLKPTLLALRAASARRSALLHTPPLPFRMADVSVRFANFLDAEFAPTWPGEVSVEGMGVGGLKRMPSARADGRDAVWSVVEARERRVRSAVGRKEEREGVVRRLVERVVGAVRGRKARGGEVGKEVEVVPVEGEERAMVVEEENGVEVPEKRI